MNRPIALTLAAGLALAFAASQPALAQHPAAAPQPGKAVSLQGAGAEQQAWINNPHMHAFYDLSRATLGGGAAKVDVNAYEQKSFAIFREFGVSMGVGAEHMQDHLKLIPRQVVQIVKDDPKVLDSYDNFVAAMMGPP
ncbi:MAG: hypothetical protein ACJ798_17755 [Phenylobacterium sp.]